VPVLTHQTIVVTGASGGIGRAIATRLAEEGATLCLCGRDRSKLDDLASRLPGKHSRCYSADLAIGKQVDELVSAILADNPSIHGIIHCAAVIHLGPVSDAPVQAFHQQLSLNTVAPFRLTQLLLPQLIKNQGQIIFVNSSAGLNARANVSQYAASKHALKALADSIRQECNEEGVRVCTIYLGDTATPMQAQVRKEQGRSYQPARLIQPEDVASVVTSVLGLARTAEVTDVVMRPMQKT
jgi:short-subunit dehydrogenase